MKKPSRVSASFLRKYFPDLVREGTPPNRYWKTRGREFASLQDVINELGYLVPDLQHLVTVWPEKKDQDGPLEISPTAKEEITNE
jgi:hypothetical protein